MLYKLYSAYNDGFPVWCHEQHGEFREATWPEVSEYLANETFRTSFNITVSVFLGILIDLKKEKFSWQWPFNNQCLHYVVIRILYHVNQLCVWYKLYRTKCIIPLVHTENVIFYIRRYIMCRCEIANGKWPIFWCFSL